MPARAKICGLSTPETLDAAIAGGAAAVGFMFYPSSPRAVSIEAAAALGRRVPDRVDRVGVMVDPDDALVDRVVAGAGLTALQLHGTSPARVAALKARSGLPVWATVGVRTRADLAAADAFVGAADRLFFDAKPPEGAARPGGLGLRFDWALLDGFRHRLPWLLGGGLDAGNVGEAIRRTGAPMVDVSSGVERAPGVKDPARIAAFLAAVAAA